MKKIIGIILKYSVLVLFTIYFLYPIIIGIFTSLKSIQEIGNNPAGFPRDFQFINYVKAWQNANLISAYRNSILLTAVTIVTSVFFSSMTAYVLARFKFKFNNMILVYFISGMMVPSSVLLIPRFLLMKDLGLLDNLLALILPGVANPLAIFMYVGFIKALSKEVEEAAIIDCCGNFRMYFQIIFPLVKPVTATIVVITAMNTWNDFMNPLIFLPSTKVNTVMLALFSFLEKYQANWNYFFAALTMSITPIIILYVVFQKDIIKGVTDGAVKG